MKFFLLAVGHEDTFHHVRDFPYLELPGDQKFWLPNIGGFQLWKFMVLQVIAALIVFLIFKGLGKRIKDGEPAKGRWWNFWESLVVYIRDYVVRPTIGTGHHHDHDDHEDDPHVVEQGELEDHEAGPVAEVMGGGHLEVQDGAAAITAGHPADQYLPFILSCFFYVLICNLLGAIPWLGSATADINVTGALAIVVFVFVVYCGTKASGVAGFWKSLAPHMDVPGIMKPILIPMVWIIEFFGLLIKHGVLAVRLFANIMAGHTVIAVILGFIVLAANSGIDWLYYAVVPASIFGQVAIGMLELFVAFLQAYVFAFLTALFVSAAVNPH